MLFTSFESNRALYPVFGDLGELFAGLLEQHGIQWSALADLDARRDIALQVMAQVPQRWIWDNREPVAGFPEGAESAWSADERAELLGFLRAATQTRARFLLTSRCTERPWLGDLPARIPVPPMPMTERAAFAEAAIRAFCAAIGGLGDYYHDQYGAGRREVIGALRAEEANLLHAWRLARRQGLWDHVIGPMQGLRQL